jgi:hypothetical protein
MECWQCGRPAQGVCRFCGRGVCKDHVSKLPFIITVYIGKPQVPKAIVVADALFCGVCRPQPEPIEMPEIH